MQKEFKRQRRMAVKQFREMGLVDMTTIGMQASGTMTGVITELWNTQLRNSLRTLASTEKQFEDKFRVVRSQVQTRVDKQLQNLADSTLATTQKTVDEALTKTREALAQEQIYGENTVRSLTKAVNNVFENAEQWRAQRIAVTESSLAVHDADIVAAEESGVVRGFELVVSDDACPLCQVYKDGEPTGQPVYPYTSLTDATKELGGRNRTLPPIHPNCRCAMRAVLIDEEETTNG